MSDDWEFRVAAYVTPIFKQDFSRNHMARHKVMHFADLGTTCAYCQGIPGWGDCPASPVDIARGEKWFVALEANKQRLWAAGNVFKAPRMSYIRGNPWDPEDTWVPDEVALKWYEEKTRSKWPSAAPAAKAKNPCVCGVWRVGGKHSDWCDVGERQGGIIQFQQK